MEEEGVVIECGDGVAKVEVLPKGWCRGCSLCGVGAKVIQAEDLIGIRKGERVVIEIPSTHLLKAGFIVYILPVIFLLSGFLLGWYVSSIIGFGGEGPSIIVGLFFLFISFLLIYLYNKLTKAPVPKIKRRIL